ncbi:fasciclin domain-containing protein [Methanoculleus taiwanensis]|nr:fasciclin domain-containing protein [Methanoculleus taiwanensis]
MATILETLRQSEDLNTFVNLVEIADLKGMLNDRGPFTVFAPTDGAFESLSGEALHDLKQNKNRLADVLMWHIVVGVLRLEEVPGMRNPTIKTLQGSELNVSIIDEEFRVNDARIVTGNIGCDNGVIHIIDGVLMQAMAEIVAR